MSNTTNKELKIIPEFLKEMQEQANNNAPDKVWPSKLKVYNVNRIKWEKIDKEKAWKIFIDSLQDWVVYAEANETKTWTILLTRKWFYWFLDSKIKPWANDYYRTQYMDIFHKWAICLVWNAIINAETDEKAKDVYMFTTIDEFRKSIIDKNSKFFDVMKKPFSWWEEYPISKIWLHYAIFFRDAETWEVYEIDPKASYWKFQKPEKWTIEYVKKEAEWLLKTSWLDAKSIELSMFEVQIWVVKDEENNVYKLDWKLKWFVKEDMRWFKADVIEYLDALNKSIIPETQSIEKQIKTPVVEDKKLEEAFNVEEMPF